MLRRRYDLSFTNDKIWIYAKKSALENGKYDWVKIISLYHELGGANVDIYISEDNQLYKIIYLCNDTVSNKQLVMCEDRFGKYHYLDYNDVVNAKKMFEYYSGDSRTEQKVMLPERYTIDYSNKKGQNYALYYR